MSNYSNINNVWNTTTSSANDCDQSLSHILNCSICYQKLETSFQHKFKNSSNKQFDIFSPVCIVMIVATIFIIILVVKYFSSITTPTYSYQPYYNSQYSQPIPPTIVQLPTIPTISQMPTVTSSKWNGNYNITFSPTNL